MAAPSAALDLCVRKRPSSPEYFDYSKKATAYVDTASCQYSPVSNSNSDSENSDVYGSTDSKLYTTSLVPKVKGSRPFKAYTKDPLTLAQGVVSVDTFRKDSMEAFAEFRSKILSQVQTNNNGTNKNMRRVPQNGQNKIEDPGYWEKRRKNNEAAKRSRDARRAKEDEIAIRCAFLEQENIQLKYRIATLEAERQRLQEIVFHT